MNQYGCKGTEKIYMVATVRVKKCKTRKAVAVVLIDFRQLSLSCFADSCQAAWRVSVSQWLLLFFLCHSPNFMPPAAMAVTAIAGV